ncbi:MAG: DUF1571 domain-containing protein [Planctomycetota bacterium]
MQPLSDQTTESATPHRKSCWLKGILFLSAALLIAIIVHRSMLEEIDPDKTKDVVVTPADSTQGADQVESNPEDQLPENAITRFINRQKIADAEYTWDPLVEIAEKLVADIDSNIQDYTATITSQVRIEGELLDRRVVECKIRHPQKKEDRNIPFSVYTKFLIPKDSAGQEAIWVDGWHENNIVAHATGLLNVKKFYLDPEGSLAMKGNLHPIWVIGFRNLLVKLIETGTKERLDNSVKINIRRNVDVNGIKCTVLESIHENKSPDFKYHIARMYIDDERNIPIGFEGFLWPESDGEEPPILEYYFYTDVKLNVGLTNDSFDPDNEEYGYPEW